MEFVKGVNLHFIPTSKYKTNRIKIRFSAPMSKDTISGRVLVASMLETANRVYPTSQSFREHLANLYGADFTTNVFRRGLVHCVDIDLSFVRDIFLSRKYSLVDELLDFLHAALFYPLVEGEGFEQATFDIEKKNLLLDLEAENENPYYYAHQELNKLFYEQQEMKLPRLSEIDLVAQETSISSFAIFQKMMLEDQIDIFFMGDFKKEELLTKMQKFSFQERTVNLYLQYRQPFSNVLKEGFDTKEINQSILELGYHFPVQYGEEAHMPLMILNGLLGGFAHSKLFANVREKECLAYTITSQMDIFSGFLRIYAGINRNQRTKALTLINRQIIDIKRGKFSDEDLEQTKSMLKNALFLSYDRQITLLEDAYMAENFGKKFLTLKSRLNSIDSVNKMNIMEVAKDIKLQAIYFLEGKG
ncbi:EF-P 5-aminopentanol modification-associated protein YfmF [Streptococcus massiliensis]|uniref:Zn-dependent peptidase n=1 Tax=Streptococcus massiliensis TaxID=313439 RepID=A0A380L0R2_9STRE|nr:pitrilysin family protein [Streptococcus massiliensis]SUN76310.1 Zn-dependent peptidase [Streptococcus massiliensis]